MVEDESHTVLFCGDQIVHVVARESEKTRSVAKIGWRDYNQDAKTGTLNFVSLGYVH